MHKSIFISGASRGLGKSLALAYARQGLHLSLIARNKEKLKKVAQECESLGATISYQAINIQDTQLLKSFILEVDSITPVDLIIANAGISSTLEPHWQPEKNVHIQETFSTNLQGTLDTIHPIIPLMMQRKKGQIALVSSLAGMRGLPQSPSYSASKGALILYGQALRSWLAPFQVQVNVICPGYIETDMSSQLTGPKPFLMSSEKAAKIIQKGLEKNKSCIAFPWQLHYLMKLANTMPSGIVDTILRGFESCKIRPLE